MRSMTVGAARSADCAEGVSVAQALQLVSVRLRALLHAFACVGEGGDAREEFEQVFRAGEVWRRALARRAGADARDLAAAHGDPQTQAVFRIEDQQFELEAERRVDQQMAEGEVVRRDMDQLLDAMAHGLGDLAKGIAREEAAQDDPEPFHVWEYMRAATPADSARPHPANRGGIALKTRAKFFEFPTELKQRFPTTLASRSTASWFALRDAACGGSSG